MRYNKALHGKSMYSKNAFKAPFTPEWTQLQDTSCIQLCSLAFTEREKLHIIANCYYLVLGQY